MTIFVAVAVEVALEGVEVVVAGGPEVRAAVAGRQLLLVEPLGVHPEGDDLFVVGAVEDPDASPLGRRLGDPPQERVVELLARRLLERDDVHALGVDAGHDVLDRRVLAGGVHRLEHDEQGVGVARPEQLLGVLQLLDALGEDGSWRRRRARRPRARRTRRHPSTRCRARRGWPWSLVRRAARWRSVAVGPRAPVGVEVRHDARLRSTRRSTNLPSSASTR